MVGGEMIIDNEVEFCNSFFDQMDDLVEFPSDNDSPLFSDDLSAFWDNPPLPYEDIAQLEWLSTFVEDSFSGDGLTITDKNENISLNKESSSEESQNSSPISSGSSTFPPSPTQRGIRTKRPRPATFTPPSFPDSSRNKYAVPCIVKIKKNKTKRIVLPALVEATNGNIPTEENVRKCTHCEITKTPQWRAGPLGPKTLCNACGVRHKSGRLFPEYRPAASPTFVASLHSNSHRKVLEMRNKCDEKSPINEAMGIGK